MENAQRLLESLWAILKGLGKMLENVQYPLERRLNCPAAVCKNMAISVCFLRSATFLFILIKIKDTLTNFKNSQLLLS
jgi:hypothetical protein